MSPHHPKSASQSVFTLTAKDTEAFKELIASRTGIVLLNHQLSVLQETINKACEQFGYQNAYELQQILKQSKRITPEFEFMVAGITVGESYFFRDTSQITLLSEKLLPELINQKRANHDLSLRIWSAGCANGQEIYSMAILLHELLPDINHWSLHFLATDINVEVLANAVEGKYRDWSLRETPPAIIEKYFTKTDENYQLDPTLCQLVKFSFLNLAEDIFPALHSGIHAIDIILCRNVFIYLDTSVIQQIMQKFAACLVPGGSLLLGPSDFVTWDKETFDFIQNDRSAYFRRKKTPQLESTDPVEKNTEATNHGFNHQEEPKLTTTDTASLTDKKNDFDNFLQSERWQDVLVWIEQNSKTQNDNTERLQIKAKAHANLGELNKALAVCQHCLKLNPTDKHTYLLQGTIFIELSEPIEAEKALRNAIFLDYAFPEAHYQLGLLQIHCGNYTKGLKSLNHAITHAKNKNPQHKIHNAPGMDYARFIEIINNEIKIYADMITKGDKTH